MWFNPKGMQIRRKRKKKEGREERRGEGEEKGKEILGINKFSPLVRGLVEVRG
jgi:hypothetical protein